MYEKRIKRFLDQYLGYVRRDTSYTFEYETLVEFVLAGAGCRSDIGTCAREIVSKYKSLSALLGEEFEVLEADESVGRSAAIMLKVIKSAVDICVSECSCENPDAEYESKIAAYERRLICQFAGETTERVRLLYLDQRGDIVGEGMIRSGAFERGELPMRRIVGEALKCAAAGMIIAHNHPSGILAPSGADQRLTENLEKVLSAVDIRLVEHFIIADRRSLPLLYELSKGSVAVKEAFDDLYRAYSEGRAEAYHPPEISESALTARSEIVTPEGAVSCVMGIPEDEKEALLLTWSVTEDEFGVQD